MDESIYSLTDSTKNSVNEKCSRIKFAFCNAYVGLSMHFYYINGKTGEKRRIALDRQMVCDLSKMILTPKTDQK